MPAPAPGAAPQQPQQPPFGAAPVSQSTPNKGYEAAALQRLGLIGKQLTEILSMVGVSTDLGKKVMKMLKEVSEMAPSESNPQVERRNIEQMATRNTQQNQQMQALKQQMAGGGGAAGGPPAAAQGAAPPMAA